MSEQEKSFEQTLMDLENIVNLLERGELSLEESMQRYEDGVKLTQTLNQKIKTSKLKIRELKENNGQ